MDRRKFFQTALTRLGALAVSTRISFPESSVSPPGRSQDGANKTREINLVAEPAKFEVGDRGVFDRWLYNGQFPGPEIRVHEGERLRVTLMNRLPEGTTIHWHGLPVPNPMDGVPDITQPAIPRGGTFVYEFDAVPSGSFMYHSHFALQPDRGLVGPLVVEEKKAHINYDRDYTLLLTDFLPGAPGSLGSMPNASGGTISMQVPPYAALLINGRLPEDPAVFNVKTGERARIRLINPSGTTIYRVAIGGHPVTITHVDGKPVEPFRVGALHIAPGERYDILVEAKSSGAWPIAAYPDNDLPPARAILRYTDSNEASPREGVVPEGLASGRMLQLGDLRALDLPEMRKPNRTFNLILSGGVRSPGARMGQEWFMNGQAYPNASPLEIHQGEAVRFRLINQSAMPHPMHLHGHFFRVANVIKDTAIVWTQAGHVDLDFVANNPGAWLFHCHNLYHMEAGMVRLVRYVSAAR
jgi:FtsP/CotA-like multicopper oxidase with cupredoxin domain